MGTAVRIAVGFADVPVNMCIGGAVQLRTSVIFEFIPSFAGHSYAGSRCTGNGGCMVFGAGLARGTAVRIAVRFTNTILQIVSFDAACGFADAARGAFRS